MFLNPKFHIKNFMVSPGMHAADFGSGSGAHSLALAETVGPKGKVYAVEIQPDLVTFVGDAAIEQGIKHLVAVQGDVEQIGGSTLADQSVDHVLISNVLEGSQQREVVLDEAFRILKTQGTLAIVDWANKPFSVMDATLMAEQQGFSYITIADAGDYHYALIMKKSENEDKRIVKAVDSEII